MTHQVPRKRRRVDDTDDNANDGEDSADSNDLTGQIALVTKMNCGRNHPYYKTLMWAVNCVNKAASNAAARPDYVVQVEKSIEFGQWLVVALKVASSRVKCGAIRKVWHAATGRSEESYKTVSHQAKKRAN